MTWIKTIPYSDADRQLRKIYDRVKSPSGQIDNILTAHSLRPHTLTGHMSLYKNVLHHKANTLPKWYLETIGVYVSKLNNCQYCIDHHFEGLKKNLRDVALSNQLWLACESEKFDKFLSEKFTAGLHYSKILTSSPWKIDNNLINELKNSGLDDGQILEINQVTAYFNYANRMVLGLGIDTNGEILGLSPSNQENIGDWNHQA